MTCDWCEERFERFLDGALSDGERARLLAHVDRCTACHGLLEELRVVDALLLAPRAVELPRNFTVDTMADVQALPAPRTPCAPIAATLVAYIVGAWSLVGAAFLIAPIHMLSIALGAMAVAGTVLAALGGLGHAFLHFGWTLAGGMAIADILVLVAVAAALRAARPRIAERLRW